MGNGLGIAWQWSAVLGCTAHSDASSRSVKGSRAPSNQRSIAAENSGWGFADSKRVSEDLSFIASISPNTVMARAREIIALAVAAALAACGGGGPRKRFPCSERRRRKEIWDHRPRGLCSSKSPAAGSDHDRRVLHDRGYLGKGDGASGRRAASCCRRTRLSGRDQLRFRGRRR